MEGMKPEFLDAKGRLWKLSLNVGLVEDIKEETKTDLDDMLSNPDRFADTIYAAPRKLVEILWVMCEAQAVEYGVDPKEFGRLFDRVTLDKAGDAFLTAIILFYPRTSAGETIRGKLPQLMQQMDQRIRKRTEDSIARALSDTVTG